MPCVSVIIPAFDSEAFLSDAIQSVEEQTWSDLELLVVDDGSASLAAEEIVQRHRQAARFPIKYLRQENRGPGAARNRGLAETDSEFVAFLDADDVFLPDKLSLQVGLLESKPPRYACVYGGYRLVLPGVTGTREVRPSPADGPIYGELIHERLVLLGTASFLHRRTCLSSVGAYDESLRNNEDLDLTLRLARQFSLLTHQDLVFENRQRTGSTSNSDPRRSLTFALRFLDKLERDDPELAPGLLRRRRQRAYFSAAKKQLQLERDFAGFRRTLDEGIKATGYPSTWRGWSAWGFARSGALGSLVTRVRGRRD